MDANTEEYFEEDLVIGEDDYDLSENNVYQKRKNKDEIPLVNDDYNLNSPIMIDIINNIHDMVNYGKSPSHHLNRTKIIWKPFEQNAIKINELKNVDSTYKFIRNYLMTFDITSSHLVDQLINTVQTEIDIIKEVVDTFMKGVYCDDIEVNVYNAIKNDKMLYNLLFKIMEINVISETMVAGKSRFNLENYEQSFKFQKKDNESLIRFQTTNFIGYMTDEIIIDTNNQIIIDKNMLLMIKDILTGRFNTLLIIVLNMEQRYTNDMVKIFKEFIYEGDKLLLEVGNEGFDSIALVESFCINRISKMADETRKFVKISSHFDDYIIDKIDASEGYHKIFLTKLNNILSVINNPYDFTLLYGSFRLWGHPYIEYGEGLGKVKQQVRIEKDEIDENYAKLLANDLMKTMLIRHFKKERQWSVKNNETNKAIKGSEPLIQNLWPKPKDFALLEGHWDELDINPILEIPEDIDDSSLFADKTHSLDRTNVIKMVKRDDKNPIPTKRVLKTYLEQKRIKVSDFIKNIDKSGLDKDKLIIGLKAKERELKRYGRFFTLMTWDLRLYFVISEYMIKQDFVKVFDGLTMSDGFIDLMNKILDRTEGQRGFDYKRVTYANHIDYSKWNNHQRDKAVGPVFTVMDKCYGLNNFIRRTHKFFEQCIVYYPERPEYFGKDSQYYWEGQPGGFEGIRQKGWSVVGILCLLRESKYRNTKVNLLAQGDNQVVFTSYKLPNKLNDDETIRELEKIYYNNDYIMKRIQKASTKLGLIINDDETVQSAGFTVYGKMPIYKGNILNLETKKANRISGITNDQLPTAANIMSSVNSTALSICQNDPNIKNGCYLHLIFGILTLNTLKLWNPMGQFGEKLEIYSKTSICMWLYHDQSLGGNTGMSLTRTLIRKFPDPITEGLSFYKFIKDNIKDPIIKEVMIQMGNPVIKMVTTWSWNKLLEDPTCLNIEKGSNIAMVIKNQVKRSLINYSDNIKNELLRNSLMTVRNQEEYILEFLKSIEPIFPRFLSDFKQASICGYIDGVIGLVQNSKTIRVMFSQEFESKVRDTVTKWEKEQWQKMKNAKKQHRVMLNWSCSSKHADKLRNESWNTIIIGSTVPHPFEYQNNFIPNISKYVKTGKKDLITCIVPKKPTLDLNHHGGNKPYLGSNTKENSGNIQSWEKELTNPIFRKASDLRRGINWIINPNTKLAKSIYQNLEYVTGLDLKEELNNKRKYRTGTAQHRYKTNRQSNGGFCNITPNILSWFIVTSDYMTDLSDNNYDFMYQASLIYTENVGSNILIGSSLDITSFGMGISCASCIREITTLNLESKILYKPQSISKKFWTSKIHTTEVNVNVELLEDFFPETDNCMSNVSYCTGFHQAINSVIKTDMIDNSLSLSDIYSMGVMMKMNTPSWLNGLIDGVILGSAYTVLNSSAFLLNNYHLQMITNRSYKIIKRLSDEPNFYPVLRLNNISDWLLTKSNYVAPSYPPSATNISRSFFTYCYELINDRLVNKDLVLKYIKEKFVIFKDSDNDNFKLMLVIGFKVLESIKTDLRNVPKLRMFKQISEKYQTYKSDPDDINLKKSLLEALHIKGSLIQISTQEMKVPVEKLSRFVIDYSNVAVYEDLKDYELQYIKIEHINNNSQKATSMECPFISGIRAYRCATGAHYKMNDILNWLNIDPHFAIIGGDGSGGISSLILRKYNNCELIFNSLISGVDLNLRGGQPGKPQAIMKLPITHFSRCVNLDRCWMEPSDLTENNTWEMFSNYNKEFSKGKRKYDLMILDMEAKTTNNYKLIYNHLVRFINNGNFKDGAFIIIKGYTGLFIEGKYEFNNIKDYVDIIAINGRFTSSYSTEIYFIIRYNASINNLDNITQVFLSENMNFSLNQDKLEYDRGISLSVKKLYDNIDRSLLENYEGYLIDYLMSLNIPPSLSKYLIALCVNGHHLVGLKDIVYYSVIAYGDNQDLISSDQIVKKLICYLSGLAYYLSITKNDFRFFRLGNLFNNEELIVFNNKVNMEFLLYLQEETENNKGKNVSPIRDNSLINLLLRSLLGCKNTMAYDGFDNAKIESKHYLITNVMDLFRDEED